MLIVFHAKFNKLQLSQPCSCHDRVHKLSHSPGQLITSFGARKIVKKAQAQFSQELNGGYWNNVDNTFLVVTSNPRRILLLIDQGSFRNALKNSLNASNSRNSSNFSNTSTSWNERISSNPSVYSSCSHYNTPSNSDTLSILINVLGHFFTCESNVSERGKSVCVLENVQFPRRLNHTFSSCLYQNEMRFIDC